MHAERLVDMLGDDDPYLHDTRALAETQLAALNERLAQRTAAIPALRRRCEEIGLKKIESFADLVPVMFSHTTYKNYPDSLVERGQWKYMNKWLATLTAVPGAENVDVSKVSGVDDWVAAMHAAGHYLNATSGTTGKCSFLDQSGEDYKRKALIPGTRWKTGIAPKANMPFFGLSSSTGFNQFTRSFVITAEAYGRPGDIHFLTDEPNRISDINKMGKLRRAMVAGTATPSELEGLEKEAGERSKDMSARFEDIAKKILAHRNEPIVLMGLAAQHWQLANTFKALGVTENAIHPDSLVGASIRGNTKGNTFPPDYAEQIFKIYGYDGYKVLAGYSMSEISTRMMQCEAGRYHIPPWQIILLLDRDATRLLDVPVDGGVVEGRAAFFDFLVEARWGAVLSGDRVSIDYAPRCACGRPGPTVLDTIERYPDVNDDKLSCSGSINSYIRGVLSNE